MLSRKIPLLQADGEGEENHLSVLYAIATGLLVAGYTFLNQKLMYLCINYPHNDYAVCYMTWFESTRYVLHECTKNANVVDLTLTIMLMNY